MELEKSAILEGLDAFFSKKPKWLKNRDAKVGLNACFVAPVFVAPKTWFTVPSDTTDLERVSENLTGSFTGIDFNAENEILICVARIADGNYQIFDGEKLGQDNELAERVYKVITDHYQLIYNDAEVDIDEVAKVDSEASEIIIGSPILSAIEKKIRDLDPKGEFVGNLNRAFTELIDDTITNKLQDIDGGYSYSGTQGARASLTTNVLTRISAAAFLETRKLKHGGTSLENLSSGQRRTALLDFVLAILDGAPMAAGKQLILAIDEPEISLDASKKMSQFERLTKITSKGVAVLFTSHWYGWIASSNVGKCILIEETDTAKRGFKPFNISNFPFQESLPKFEMRMVFDFLVSLGAGAEVDSEKKFIVCEGVSDQTYLEASLDDDQYKIIFVGKDRAKRLSDIFKEYYWKSAGPQIKNVVFIIDTDPEHKDEYGSSFYLKRWSKNKDLAIDLVVGEENFHERCALEDALDPDAYLAALKSIFASESLIQLLEVKYPELTGENAFGMDAVTKKKFDEITKKVKVPVAQKYKEFLPKTGTNHVKTLIEKIFSS